MTDNRNDLQPGNNNEYAEEGIEGRHRNPRAPRRRTAGINKEELQSIQNSIEQSLSVYEKADCKAEHYNKAYKPENTEELPYSRKAEKGAFENSVTGADKNTAAGAADDIARSKSGKKKHPVLKTLLVIVVCCAAFLGYRFFSMQSGYYTVAVFGVDSRNGNVGKDALSDVNILARVDMATGEIKLVSMYRDTYTMINSDGKFHKLNEAYFKGGPEQAIWAVEHNTDVKVDDYATFNWKAVADTINILGGVDLEITDKEFKYINAFITETVNSTGIGSYQLEHAGMNHLDGVQAVAYARLRLMDTDYQRTERQRKVIGLALEKARNADYATLCSILTAVLPQINTSVTIDDLLPFAKNISKYYIGETAGFPFDRQGMDVGKLDCVVPVTLESNAVKLHEFLYPDESYTPSSQLKEISDKIISVTGLDSL